MNKKLLFGFIVVVIVGTAVGYQLFYRVKPVAQMPAASPSQTPQSSPSSTRPTAAEIVRSCIGDGAYLEGTDRHFSSIDEIGSYWIYTPESHANTEFFNLLSEHPIVCPLTEQYELVYRFPRDMLAIFTSRKEISGAKLFVRDRQSGQEVLLTEHGPAPVSSPNEASSGGMAGIFLTIRPNGVLDFSRNGGGDVGGSIAHSLFNPKTGTVLEYLLGSAYRDRSTIRIAKGNRKWVVNPVVTESTTGKGVNAVGTVVVKGIAVNGTLIKKFDVERKTSVETDISAYPIGAGLNYGVTLGSSRNVSVKDGYHSLDDVYVNDDFSKMMFRVKLSVQNPTGGSEAVDLGTVEIDLR